MPVLLESGTKNVFSTVDIENLVTDVRERLCLKNPEIIYQYHSEYGQRFNYNQNSTTGSICHHDNIDKEVVMKGSNLISKSTKSSSDIHSKRLKKRSSYLHVPYDKQTLLSRDFKGKGQHAKSSSRPKSSNYEDPHLLLQKLISEQSLIQEAVRRLQKSNFQDLKNAKSELCLP